MGISRTEDYLLLVILQMGSTVNKYYWGLLVKTGIKVLRLELSVPCSVNVFMKYGLYACMLVYDYTYYVKYAYV